MTTYLNVSGEHCSENGDGHDQQQMVHDGKTGGSHRRVPIRSFGTNDSVQVSTTLLYATSSPSCVRKGGGPRTQKLVTKDNMTIRLCVCIYVHV